MSATTFEAVDSGGPLRPCATKEADLVARLKADDHMAFQELVERYRPKMLAAILSILTNRDDADEIAQEVFAKVYFGIPTFDARSSLYTWIYRIAVNECYGFLRKQRLRLVGESDPPGDVLSMRLLSVADPRPLSDRAVLQQDFVSRLLAGVPEDDRQLFLLKEVEGFSLAELSEVTGQSLNIIKVRLSRIRQKLMKTAARLESPMMRTGGS